MRFNYCLAAFAASLVFLAGCTTESAKKAMDKPMPTDQYSGFGAGGSDKAKRKAEKPKEVKDDMDPEVAVSTLALQLRDDQASYSMLAEEQLQYWGGKPGVAPIVVRAVRPMLKSSKVEHRAPALRLTVMFGGKESVGDLIECLADSEYGIRQTAAGALQSYSPKTFGYDPASGETARAKSVDQFRRWWQDEKRNGAVGPATIYENNPPQEASVKAPRQSRQSVTSSGETVR